MSKPSSTLSQPSPLLLRKCRIALAAAGVPESEANEKAVVLATMVAAAVTAAPSPDMTIPQVGAYRNESNSTIQRKMRPSPPGDTGGTGKPVYESYLSGPDKRLITRESVEIDRSVCLLMGPRFDQGGKRGRPKKALESAAAPDRGPSDDRGGEAPPEAEKPTD
jgi:hypothetical protein